LVIGGDRQSLWVAVAGSPWPAKGQKTTHTHSSTRQGKTRHEVLFGPHWGLLVANGNGGGASGNGKGAVAGRKTSQTMLVWPAKEHG